MEIPCKQCLIQVNCSEECYNFKNYMTLLNNALKNFRGHYKTQQYKYYKELKEEAEEFSHIIFTRGLEKAVENIFN